MAPIPLFVLFSLIHHLVLVSSSTEETKFYSCCPTHACGKLDSPQSPFNNTTHPECGVVILDCSEDIPKTQLREGGRWYHIDPISPENSSFIKGKAPLLYPDFHRTNCDQTMESFSLLQFLSNKNDFRGKTVTLYKCSHNDSNSPPGKITCGDYDFFYKHDLKNNISFPFEKQCSSVRLPIPEDHPDKQNPEIPPPTDITFEVHVSPDCHRCHYEGGKCQISTEKQFYCKNAPTGQKKLRVGLGLGLGLGLGVPLVIILAFFIWRGKQKRAAASILSRNISDPYINLDQEVGSGYLGGVLVFSYKDLKEATNNFNDENELGDGGFGTVYHGKLKDGREVAVKRLYEHNYKRVEQFLNEIEILTRLRHKNLVSLYGCTSRHCRELLLVYEYIPNGTVADHLHGDRAKTSPLSWRVRMSIAIETASALVYLHASDIVHRDVKTNNILLDNNFCVKVADFGLSRLFPNDVTHISTAPQGTPGYVDPEYRQCYQLTSKSDVYSFGVVLVELISSMPAVDITRHRHEINLSNLAISKIQKRAYNELVDPCLGFDSDTQVKTMIIAVAELAFLCLQQDKEMRPSMDEVLETLKEIEIGNNETENKQRNEALDGSGLMKKEQPPSPNTVTENWASSKSTNANISG